MDRPSSIRTTRAWRLAGGVAAWAGFVFLLMPTLIIVPISLGGGRELSFPPRELSFDLYGQFFSDPSWWGATLQSVKIGVLTTAASLVLAVPASYAWSGGSFPGGGFSTSSW